MELEQYFHQGRFKLEIVPHEMKMSHWVYAPILTDTLSDHCCFNLTHKAWDLVSVTETGNAVILLLDKYSEHQIQYEIHIFIDKNEAVINGQSMSVFDIETFLKEK